MSNLTRYTLSWVSFLVTLFFLSAPISGLVLKAAGTQSGRMLISAIVVGGVLPFGYYVNLIPLLFFRLSRSAGLFDRANDRTEPRGLVTDEMESQCQILQERLRSLSDCDKVISEARLVRAEKWTHLIIHYNLISTLVISLIVWITIASLCNDWSSGLIVVLGEKSQSISLGVVLGALAVILCVLAVTAVQTRWELIRVYQIELERLSEIGDPNADINQQSLCEKEVNSHPK